MDIQQTTATAPQTATPRISEAEADASALSSDFETFLKMLTVQMQNQDPLNPLDSTEFAMQLATFSGVEQAVKTNQLLEAMQGQFNLLGLAQISGWVGQEARVTAPVHMDGTPVTIVTEPKAGASSAVLVVKDAAGSVVAREDIPRTGGSYQWLGGGIDGNPLPEGTYTLSVESYSGEDLIATSDVEHYATILEARSNGTGTALVLRGGVEVPSTAVTALRAI
jgi:flagellar basal-body rod modification protein FlgD